MIELTSKKIIIIAFLFVIIMLISGCTSKETYMVEMRDGVHLATDVYLPQDSSQHGAILFRTPYNKNSGYSTGTYLAKMGWPAVIQDMRGRYASEGIDTVFRNAQTDGPDTLSWIADQSWSNGKIATYGGSALGINQYFMAGANPPNLAGQYIQVAAPNMYKHAIYQGGQFRESLVAWWLEGQGSSYVLPEYFAHENYTLDYWTNVSMDGKWGNVQVPAIHIGGWYDCFAQGTIDGFIGYQHHGGDNARGKSKLIMGPWTHGGGVQQGELVYPDNANDNFSLLMFFDMIEQYTMDGSPNYDQWPSVIFYVMGDVDNKSSLGNQWVVADEWPIPSVEVPLYLHSTHRLSTTVEQTSSQMTYHYDPTDPVPTVGGQNLNLPRGPYDQRIIEDRDDVLVFTTDVLTESAWITGNIIARLFVSSDCPDTDFTVKLSDVYPDGRSMLITDGILRMRNRNGPDHWEFMEPEEIYEVEVDLWSTSYLFEKGHQIRVVVSSSNAPRFRPNPNTREPMAQNVTYDVAQNSIHLGKEYPSCILLPLSTQVYEEEVERSQESLYSCITQSKTTHHDIIRSSARLKRILPLLQEIS